MMYYYETGSLKINECIHLFSVNLQIFIYEIYNVRAFCYKTGICRGFHLSLIRMLCNNVVRYGINMHPKAADFLLKVILKSFRT